MSGEWLVQQLPAHLLDDPFFRRFVGIFGELADGLRDHADGLEYVVDVTVAPDPLVRYVGRWLGVESIDPSLPVERQRELVRGAGRLLVWRGTRRGLAGFLELVTGAPAEVTEAGGVFRRGESPRAPAPVHVRVEDTGQVTDEHLLVLLRNELPANVEFELRVGPRVVWPPHPRLSAGERPPRPPRTVGTRRPVRRRAPLRAAGRS
ncbi:MAG TPA: phage tail protein [Acidimicrobiales bacterium]|nr:phage tail protein [Acidimicrobiales bacterium]